MSAGAHRRGAVPLTPRRVRTHTARGRRLLVQCQCEDSVAAACGDSSGRVSGLCRRRPGPTLQAWPLPRRPTSPTTAPAPTACATHPPAQPMNTSPQSSVSRLSIVRPHSMPPSSSKAPAGQGRAGQAEGSEGCDRLGRHEHWTGGCSGRRCTPVQPSRGTPEAGVSRCRAASLPPCGCHAPPLTRQPRLFIQGEQGLQRRQWRVMGRRQVQQRQRGTHADACSMRGGVGEPGGAQQRQRHQWARQPWAARPAACTPNPLTVVAAQRGAVGGEPVARAHLRGQGGRAVG